MFGKQRYHLVHDLLQSRSSVTLGQIEQDPCRPVKDPPRIFISGDGILERRFRIACYDGIHLDRLLVDAEFHGSEIILLGNLFKRRNPV